MGGFKKNKQTKKTTEERKCFLENLHVPYDLNLINWNKQFINRHSGSLKSYATHNGALGKIKGVRAHSNYCCD